jgi:2-keto-4-pentenoate hydratase/2-oxohepta-3-ene-1,7-dioic acid hydratase in catechol pathway
MRLCRFGVDELVLTAFYDDERIIPIAQAAEAYAEAEGTDLDLPATEDLLELLPPEGEAFQATRKLAEWVESPDAPDIESLSIPIDDVQLLVPIARPSKILLLAGNYAAHVTERGGTAAERNETYPYIFMKPPTTTLTNPGDPIIIPRISPDQIDWECELGIVIGRRCRDVTETEALDYIAGYTVVNDVSDRKYLPNPGRKPRERDKFFDWLHGKWHDTFCPVGPCILSSDSVPDPQNLSIRLTVNGELKQNASTSQMIFPVAAIVSFLSDFVTLEPGDIIATGTPAGVGASTGTYLRAGDLVVATIPEIGSLINPVEAEDD